MIDKQGIMRKKTFKKLFFQINSVIKSTVNNLLTMLSTRLYGICCSQKCADQGQTYDTLHLFYLYLQA